MAIRLREIENKIFIDLREENDPSNNRGYSVYLLSEIKDHLYPNGEFERARSYAELYAITLQRLFEIENNR